jgi:ABC-type oligopeptide transport system substrate-binding subunit
VAPSNSPGTSTTLRYDFESGQAVRQQLLKGEFELDDDGGLVLLRDGSKVTADDVVFSYDRVMDPKNNSLYSQFTDFVIDSITKKDESTVVIKLKFMTRS